jgi:hypothetical protein
VACDSIKLLLVIPYRRKSEAVNTHTQEGAGNLNATTFTTYNGKIYL